MKLLPDPTNVHFYFNLSGDVGPGRPNALDDVEFVRLGIRCMRAAFERRGLWGQPQMSEFRSAHQGLETSGGFDDRLGAAIRALQAGMGGRTVDGVCSTMPPGQVRLRAGGKLMMCAGLQTELRNDNPAVWPRLDRITGCGPALSAAVRRIFGLDLG